MIMIYNFSSCFQYILKNYSISLNFLYCLLGMASHNIQSLPSQFISKQKQTIRIKQNQLSQKFKWLSKYLTPENDENFNQHNIIAKSIKFHQKANYRKIHNRAKTQNNPLISKNQETVKTKMQILCAENIRQNGIRPLTSHKHIRQNSMIIESFKTDKLRGRSFLLHNFNSTNIGKFHSRKGFLNKTVIKEKRVEEIPKKRIEVIEQKFLLSPWDVELAGKQNKENNFLLDQIALQ